MERAPEPVRTLAESKDIYDISDLANAIDDSEAQMHLDKYLDDQRFGELSLEGQESFLIGLLNELGETEGQSTKPLNNKNRFAAEEVAKRLADVISARAYLSTNSLTEEEMKQFIAKSN